MWLVVTVDGGDLELKNKKKQKNRGQIKLPGKKKNHGILFLYCEEVNFLNRAASAPAFFQL